MNKKETVKIIKAIQHGGLKEQEALELAYDKCWNAARRLRSQDLSEEELRGFFVDALLKIRDRIKEGKNDIHNICSYIYKTTRTIWLDTIKEKKKKKGGYEVFYKNKESDKSIEDIIDLPELKKERELFIEDLKENIGDECLELISKKEADWPMEEIALVLGYKNANSAKTQLYKCRKKIKNFLRKKN